MVKSTKIGVIVLVAIIGSLTAFRTIMMGSNRMGDSEGMMIFELIVVIVITAIIVAGIVTIVRWKRKTDSVGVIKKSG